MDVQRVGILLRAVNVGGRALRIDVFREALVGLGYDAPRTLLQSGNAVAGVPGVGTAKGAAKAEAAITAALQRACGIEADAFVRTAGQWRALVQGNPFPDQAAADPARLVAVVLTDVPSDAGVARLRAAIAGPELVHPGDRHLYIVYPDGQGRSKLTGGVIEKALGTRGTARNWNTVLKLDALLHA